MHCNSQVLLIHYKRFKPVRQGDQFLNIKLLHPVEARPELHINGQQYDLVGVLVHQGESANSGHYFFDTVCPPYTTTRLAFRSNNDDRPYIIDMETLVDDVNNAYMLAYQKAAEPPREQPAAACVPPPAERTPFQQNVEEVVDTRSDAEIEAEEAEEPLKVQPAVSIPEESVPSQTSETDEMYFKDLLRKRDAILNTKLDDRSLAERAQYKRLAEQIKKLKDKFPCINVKPKSKARPSAERKAASRQNPANRKKERESDRERKATDENRAKDRARKAADEAKTKTAARMGNDKNKAKTAARMGNDKNKAKTAARMGSDENMARDCARKATSEYKAADLQRKTAKKANVKVKARDGLKSDLILSGKFGVETNSLGAMDKVN